MNINIDTNIVNLYQQYVSGAVNDFLPLITATIGIFLAFAIANMLRHYLTRMVK